MIRAAQVLIPGYEYPRSCYPDVRVKFRSFLLPLLFLTTKQIYVRGTSLLVIGSIVWPLTTWILCVSLFILLSAYRLIPVYHRRPSMHGTLLDQRVFESLVQRYLPIIHDHFQVVDVQLSVASLPWFLSLFVTVLFSEKNDTQVTCRYINSMPMIFAFRIVDCFLCMGPKVLFQVGCVCHSSKFVLR